MKEVIEQVRELGDMKYASQKHDWSYSKVIEEVVELLESHDPWLEFPDENIVDGNYLIVANGMVTTAYGEYGSDNRFRWYDDMCEVIRYVTHYRSKPSPPAEAV